MFRYILTHSDPLCIIVLPYMASIIHKKKANQLYYYVVESARVDGKPRIGPADLSGNRRAPRRPGQGPHRSVPPRGYLHRLRLPGALWLAAQQTGVFDALESLWPKPVPDLHGALSAAGRHPPHLPARPQTEVPDWYRRTVLHSLWGFPAERFDSQAFWDCFDRIQTDTAQNNELDQAQSRLLETWKQKQLVGRRLLAYDTTNFYTYVASTNTRAELPQRGHNKQGRHNLRQVGLSYVLDGENGLSLCHHVYPATSPMPRSFPSRSPARWRCWIVTGSAGTR